MLLNSIQLGQFCGRGGMGPCIMCFPSMGAITMCQRVRLSVTDDHPSRPSPFGNFAGMPLADKSRTFLRHRNWCPQQLFLHEKKAKVATTVRARVRMPGPLVGLHSWQWLPLKNRWMGFARVFGVVGNGPHEKKTGLVDNRPTVTVHLRSVVLCCAAQYQTCERLWENGSCHVLRSSHSRSEL